MISTFTGNPFAGCSWRHFTPDIKSAKLKAFCRELSPSAPQYIPVRPELLSGRGPMAIGRCYENVDRYRKLVGGTFQHGWMIWQTGRIYLRAYHHCVHSNGGILTDVSWQPNNREVFVPSAAAGAWDDDFLRENGCVNCRFCLLNESDQTKRILELHQAKTLLEPHSAPWLAILEEIGAAERELHEVSND